MSSNQRSSAVYPKGRFTFRLSGIFVATSVIALFLAVSNQWNAGVGILAVLLTLSARRLFQRKAQTTKAMTRLCICLAVMAILGIIFSCAGWPIGVFQLEGVLSYYCDGKPLVIDDIWVHTVIEGKRSRFCIPPIAAGRYEGPPFNVGLKVVDYDNRHECESMEITSLVLTCAGRTHVIVQKGSHIQSSFSTYVDGVASVKSDCLTDVGTWLSKNSQSPVEIDVIFVIHMRQGTIKGTTHATMRPQERNGWSLVAPPDA